VYLIGIIYYNIITMHGPMNIKCRVLLLKDERNLGISGGIILICVIKKRGEIS